MQPSNPKVLITGGAGFIGRATGRLLIERGWQVVALDILDPQVHGTTAPEMPEGVHLIQGDVRDRSLVAELLRDSDAVLHLAARTGVGQSMYAVSDYVDTNVGGTAALLEVLAAGKHSIRKLVVASSRAVYGEGAYNCTTCGQVFPTVRTREQLTAGVWGVECPLCGGETAAAATAENKPLAPGSVYAITKRDQEEMCLCIGQAYGIETHALRYFNVYGAGQPLSNPYTGVIPVFASRVLSGRAAEVYEDGEPLRDFVHLDDVALANVLALEANTGKCETLNIGSAEPISIFDAAKTVTQALGGDQIPEISGKFRIGDIRQCFGDVSLARRTLGYVPTVSFLDGVRSMVTWLREQYTDDCSDKASDELASHGLLGTAAAR
jgi:dTDP-L-rhamnose 4-epimerase